MTGTGGDLQYKLVLTADAAQLQAGLRQAEQALGATAGAAKSAATATAEAGRAVSTAATATTTAATGLGEVARAATTAAAGITRTGASAADAGDQVERMSARASGALQALTSRAQQGTAATAAVARAAAEAARAAEGAGIQAGGAVQAAMDNLVSFSGAASTAVAEVSDAVQVSAGQIAMGRQTAVRNLMDIGNVAVATGGHLTSMLSPLPDLFYGLSLMGGRLAGVWSALAGPGGLVLMIAAAMAPALLASGEASEAAARATDAYARAQDSASRITEDAVGKVERLKRSYQELTAAQQDAVKSDLRKQLEADQAAVEKAGEVFREAARGMLAPLRDAMREAGEGDLFSAFTARMRAVFEDDALVAVERLQLELRALAETAGGEIAQKAASAADAVAVMGSELRAASEQAALTSAQLAELEGRLTPAEAALLAAARASTTFRDAMREAGQELADAQAVLDAYRRGGEEAARVAEDLARARRDAGAGADQTAVDALAAEYTARRRVTEEVERLRTADRKAAEEGRKAAEDRKRAAEQWAADLDALIDRYDPLAAAQRAFNAEFGLLEEALAKGAVTAEQYDSILGRMVERYAAAVDAADPLRKIQEDITQQLTQQLEELELRLAYEGDTTGELEVQLELLRLRHDLERRGIENAAAVAASYEDQVRAVVAANRELERAARELATPIGRAFSAMAGEIEDGFKDAWKAAFKEGENGFERLMSAFENMFLDMLAELAYQAIAKPIIVPVMQQVGGALGLSQAATNKALGVEGGGTGGFGLPGMGGGNLFSGDFWTKPWLTVGGGVSSVTQMTSAAGGLAHGAGVASVPGGVGNAAGAISTTSSMASPATFQFGAGQALGAAGFALSAFNFAKNPSLGSGLGLVGSGAALASSMSPALAAAAPWLGPAGIALAIAGPLLGGMLNKKNPHPAFHSSLGAQGGEAGYFGLTDWSQKHLDDDTPKKVGAALAEAANAAMKGLLGSDARVLGSDRFALSYDEKKKRYSVHGEGGVMLSEHGENMEAAVADLIFRAIKSGDYEGVGEDIATAIRNSVATNLDELAADLQFVRQRDTMFDAPEVIGQVEASMRSLIGSYDAAVAKAEQLGVSTDGMTKSFVGALKRMAEPVAEAGPFAAAMKDMVRAMALATAAAGDAAEEVTAAWVGAVQRLRGSLHQQVALGLLDQADPRQAAIWRARQQVEAMRAEFAAVGGDPELLRWYEQVTMARAEEGDAIAAQISLLDTVASSWRRVEGAVVRFRDHLLGSADLYPGSPEDRYRAAMAEFQAALLAAQSDPEQAARVEDLARIAAEASLAFNGATLQYAQDIALIDAGLQGLETIAMRELRAAEDAVAELRSANQWLGAIEAALKALQVAAAPVRDWGANPTLNQQLAGITGYTGDFGSGQFGAWVGSQSQAVRDQVNATLAANGISGRFQRGGVVGSYESGGVVANGIWNTDSVIARYGNGGAIMVAGGEHITRATSVTPETLPVLEQINHTGRLPVIHAPPPGNDLAPLARRLDRMAAQTDRLVELTAAAVTETAQARRQLELARADTAAARAEAWQQRATGSYGR